MDFLNEILKEDLPVPQTWVPAPANTNTSNQLVATVDVSEQANNDVSQDATDSRDTIRTLIVQGLGAVNDLCILAKNTNTPRSFEVLATMLKTVSELNHDLMKIHADERELAVDSPKEENDDVGGNIHIDKAVFVGSTTDLAAIVKQKKAELLNGNSTITVEAEEEK